VATLATAAVMQQDSDNKENMTINRSAIAIVADSWLVLGFPSIFLPESLVSSCYCLAKRVTVVANATTALQQIAGNNCHSRGPVPFF